MLKKFTGKRGFRAHETHRMDTLDGAPLASFRRRAFAILIDFAAVEVLRLIFRMNGHHAANEAPAGSFTWFLMEGTHRVEELLESALYFAVVLKVGKGQTLGKKLMKIRVVSLTHRDVSWWQSIERALGYGASLLEGGFGFAQYYIHRNRQCVHDRIAETIVVDVMPESKPSAAAS